MKTEPEIIKELREAERLGKLKYNIKSEYNLEEKPQEEDKQITISENGFKNVKNGFNLSDIEQKYKSIFENYAVAITIADEKERIVSWNKYAEQLLEMTEKELALKPVSYLYPSDEWNKIRAENIRKKGMKFKLETKMMKKNGEPFDVEVSLCVLKGPEGKAVGSIGIIKDISKLKNIEKKLIESELKYKTIFENSAVAITLTDENERIISWNKYAEKMFQMSEADLHLKPVQELYTPKEWKKIRLENVRKKGMQHHLETKIIRKNKELLDVDISLSVLKDHQGKVIGTIGVFKDISEQKRIERELILKHDLLKSLLDNIPDCIYFKDKHSKFVVVNNAKAKKFNTSFEDMIGKTDHDFFTENYANESIKDDKRVMETGKPIINKIEKVEDIDGEEYWVSVTKIPRYDENGKIIGTMGINRDITTIKKSEKKYKDLFEKAIDPIIILDKKGKFIDINEQVTKLLGFNKEDLIGKKFNETKLLTKDSLSQSLDNFSKRMKGFEVPSYEVKVLTKNGEILPAEINASAIVEEGEIIGDLVIIRDLRERYKKKEIEKELVDSENRFRDIFDSTSDFLIYIEKGIILDINKTALALSGFKKQNIIGKKFSDIKKIFSDEDLQKHINVLNRAIKGEKLKDYETDLIGKDGYICRFLFAADCIKEDKEIKGILIRGKDITQRQRAWEELVKLEERYRVLAETSADGVVTIDPLGRLTYINPSFEKMCSRRKSQILATLFRDYLSENSIYFFQQVFIDARKKDEKVENVELELIHSKGNLIPIEVNLAPLKKNNKFAGMVCTIRDITERRTVEDELKKSERLKTEFMNIAAHELKSPVTPIKGYLDLIISDKTTSEQIKGWAKISLRNAERLLRLVNDILDVSRLDTDTMRFEMEKLDTVEILNEVAEDMKAVVEGKGLKFESDIPKDLPNIMGDRHRLSQVFKNLLVNSVKFTDNGSISIDAKKENDYILIAVKDTGIGVSKIELKKIFNKFYQAYTGDDRKNEGTGLGLFICKEILKKHSGEIWADSELGKGSQFFIKLPYIHKMIVNLEK